MWICITPCREHTTKALRYGTHSQGISQFYLHTPCSSTNGTNHTCFCLLSRSWYSFTNPGGMEGWVGLEWLVGYILEVVQLLCCILSAVGNQTNSFTQQQPAQLATPYWSAVKISIRKSVYQTTKTKSSRTWDWTRLLVTEMRSSSLIAGVFKCLTLCCRTTPSPALYMLYTDAPQLTGSKHQPDHWLNYEFYHYHSNYIYN